jgi:hypothetical protein
VEFNNSDFRPNSAIKTAESHATTSRTASNQLCSLLYRLSIVDADSLGRSVRELKCWHVHMSGLTLCYVHSAKRVSTKVCQRSSHVDMVRSKGRSLHELAKVVELTETTAADHEGVPDNERTSPSTRHLALKGESRHEASAADCRNDHWPEHRNGMPKFQSPAIRTQLGGSRPGSP